MDTDQIAESKGILPVVTRAYPLFAAHAAQMGDLVEGFCGRQRVQVCVYFWPKEGHFRKLHSLFGGGTW